MEQQLSATELGRHLKQVSKKFEHLIPRAGSGTLDSKELHKFRVLTRRLRCTLWVIDQASGKRSFKKLERSLRKLGRILGEQRQLEVLVRDAATYKIKCRWLKARRRSAQKELVRFLRPKTRAKLQKKLREAVGAMQKKSTLDLALPGRKLKTRLDPWLKSLPRNSAKLHRLRIQVKKARYALEALGNNVAPIEKLQDTLGRTHDLQVLQDVLGRNARVQRAERAELKRARKMIGPTLRFTLEKLAVSS